MIRVKQIEEKLTGETTIDCDDLGQLLFESALMLQEIFKYIRNLDVKDLDKKEVFDTFKESLSKFISSEEYNEEFNKAELLN